MCNPAAYAVFQVASAVNDYNNANNAAKATNANAAATATRIRNEAIYSDNALIRKKERETEKISQQKFVTNIKTKKLLSEAKVGIGEKGIVGINYYGEAIDDTWDEYKDKLMDAYVKDIENRLLLNKR